MQVFKNNVSLEATPAGDTHIVNKAYLEDRISKINVQHAIKVDELPTCTDNGDSTYTISYVKDGTTETTTDTSQWFYYLDDNGNLKQTIFLEGEELTIDGAEIALDDYVGKETFENTISELEANFANGVNTIYDAVVLKGQTPLDKTPDSIKNAIGNITTGEGATGIFDTLPYAKMKVTSTANASLGCSNAPTGYTSKGLCVMSNSVNTGNSMTFVIGENEIEQLGSYCVGTSNTNSNITDIDVQELNRVETLYYFMHDSSKLKSLVFSGKVDTSKCTNMYASFYNNTSLESLDLSKFDTSNVTTMYAMFRLCKTLASVNLSSFDTSKVTDMSGMFDACNALKELDLSHFDVSKCIGLSLMMQNCTSLTDLNINGWQLDSLTVNPLVLCRTDTGSKVIAGCNSLKNLIANNVGTKSTSTVSMNRLLEGCYAEHIELDNLNIPNVTNLGYAIASCPNLKSLSFKNLYAPKLTVLEALLYNCPNLEELDITGLDTSNVTNINNMFNGCKSIKELDLSSWDMSNVITYTGIFLNMSALTDLNISNWVFDKIAINDSGNYNLGKQMSGCTALENLIANNLAMYTGVNFNYKFYDCPAKNIQANNWDLESVTTMGYLFGNAKAESISIENLKMPKCTNISYAFAGCKSLKQLDLSSWDVSTVNNFAWFVQNCTSLTELNLNGWDFSSMNTNHHVTDNCLGVYMGGCTALENLYANEWKSGASTNFSRMLYTCNARNIFADNWDVPNATSSGAICESIKSETVSMKNLDAPLTTTIVSTFNNCPNLKTLDITGWNVPLNKTLEGFLRNCPLLETVDFTGWSDTSNVTTAYQMFLNDKGLKTLDLRPLNLDNVTNSSDMFNGCTALEELDLSNWNTAKLATRSNMFKNVPATCVIKVGSGWTLTEAQTGFTGTFTVV